MTLRIVMAVLALHGLTGQALWAQTAAVKARVHDHGPNSYVAGPGAPAHVVGLTRVIHDITLNTGAVAYGLRYVISEDPKDPAAAIPGEGYIGMCKPVDSNWYGGGFFDLKLNGQTVGTRRATVFAGQSSGERAYVDYVFDTPQAVVRVRFVGLPGGDCLFAQVLLEPRVEITEVSVGLRCYPAGYITGPTRRALTAARELSTGKRESLDPGGDWWLNYSDSGRGEGGCSAMWLPGQTQEAVVNVGSYSIDTSLKLDPALRDFRFVFFDHTGRNDAQVQADLKARAAGLREELTTFVFADSAVLDWSLAEKQAAVRELLAALPGDAQLAARYDQWSRDLEEQLGKVRSGETEGGIMAEAAALKTITEWDRSLPELRLLALIGTL